MTIPYWADDVRRWDRDRFLCALLAPEDQRSDLLTLYAFNTEISRIRETVSEPLLGNIRLQWWRDTTDAIFAGTPPRHDLAEALAAAITRYELPRHLFEQIFDAREFDMQDRPPEDMGALVAYGEGTASTVQTLALNILDGTEEGAIAVRDLGIAWALTGILRATPFHASAKRSLLPADLLKAHGLDAMHLSPSKELNRVVETVAEVASESLARSRQAKGQVPKAARNAMLLAPLADSYLKCLGRAGFDPFHPSMRGGAAQRQLKLAWHSFWGSY